MRRLHTGFIWGALVGVILFPAVPLRAVSDDVAEEARGAASVRLQAIGGLSAVNSEHTYLMIVAVSDGFSRGNYDAKSVRPKMNRVIRQLDTCSNLLRQVQKEDLSEEDDAFVELIISVHARLQAQARSLIEFSETRGDAEARTLEKARRAARKELDKLLNADVKTVVPESAGSNSNS